MRKSTYSLAIAAIFLIACNTNTLDRQTATDLIKKEYQYPTVLDHSVFCNDPGHLQKVLKTNLEEQGLVILRRTRKLMDFDSPLITFTDAAKPYFLPVSSQEKEIQVQNVKIADEDFLEITDLIISKNRKKAVVAYTTVYKNLTPMAALLRKALPSEVERKAYFALTDKGWKVVKKADFEFMELMN